MVTVRARAKGWLQRWGGTAAALVLLIVGGLLLKPRRPPELAHSSVLNAIFDSPWLIGAVRLVAIAGALYVLASVAARIGRGQWLKRVGPLDADTSVEAVATDQGRLQQELDRANTTIQDLRSELNEALDFIDEIINTDGAGAKGGAAVGEGTPGDIEDQGGGPRKDQEGPPGSG